MSKAVKDLTKRKREVSSDSEEEVRAAEVKKAKSVIVKSSSKEAKATKKEKVEEKKPEVKESVEEEIKPEEQLTSYRISTEIITNLKAQGVTKLFPIQYKTFDPVYDGKDLIGRARTGTGKTYAFGIPIIEKLKEQGNKLKAGRSPRVIVLTPTRELAQQISLAFYNIMPSFLKITCIFGGVSYLPQERDLRNGIDIVVGTPGRVMDLIKSNKLVLTSVDFVVLDEADEMLNFGFSEIIEQILSCIPKEKDRQTVLFSATLPEWIKKVCATFLKRDHVTIDLIGNDRVKVAANTLHMAMNISNISYSDFYLEIAGLADQFAPNGKTILFCTTKVQCSELAQTEPLLGKCVCIHGDLNQQQRNKALDEFLNGRYSIMIATDVAARGLDIPNVDLVINYEAPKSHETFTHRVGRTARAGKSGKTITFFSEMTALTRLQQTLGFKFTLINGCNNNDKLNTELENSVQFLKQGSEKISKSKEKELFYNAATELLKETKDAASIVAVALELMCKAKGAVVKSSGERSLLYGIPGYVTVTVSPNSSNPFETINKLAGGEQPHNKLRTGGYILELPKDIATQVMKKDKNVEIAPASFPDIMGGYQSSSSSSRFGGGGFRRSGGGGGYGGRSGGSGYGRSRGSAF